VPARGESQFISERFLLPLVKVAFTLSVLSAWVVVVR
jgi:hypothetical protein